MLKKAIIIALIAGVLVTAAYFVAGRQFLSNTAKYETAPYVQINTQKKPVCQQSDVVNYAQYKFVPATARANNKFGLYVYAESADFLEYAQVLVNSNGGEWGYVLLPYNIEDRDSTKWRRVFDQLNNKKLIPIIQLHMNNLTDYKKETVDAASFLNSFIWPIRQHYVSVYNEPNDAKFWFGKVDPAGYARVLDFTIKTFKAENSDFFMMNAGFNVSAGTGGDYLDSFEYMKRMQDAVPDIFDELDGWASHSYPQPNFAGGVHDTGRGSIRAYDVELNYLKNSLGVKKDLPVFITETGWAHAEGKEYNSSFLPLARVAENFRSAYRDVWLKDDRVMAVTPFTIWYDAPFDHFSWISSDKQPFAHFVAVQKMPKIEGNPETAQYTTVSVLNCGNTPPVSVK